MNIFKTLFKTKEVLETKSSTYNYQLVKNQPLIIRNPLLEFDSLNNSELADYFNRLIASTQGNPTVAAVINLLSDKAAEMMNYVELLDKDNKEVQQHWVLDILNNPNKIDDKFTFIKSVFQNLLLHGNSFIYFTPNTIKTKSKFYSANVLKTVDVDIITTKDYLNPI